MTTPSIPSVALCICGDPACNIPYGTCHCECGTKTILAPYSMSGHRRVKGLPVMFLNGHQTRKRGKREQAQPFKIEGVYCRLIPLSRGLYAIVWESDYEWLMKWRWNAQWDRDVQKFYAMRSATGTRVRSMHSFIIGAQRGSKCTADHINGHTLDNRRINLRPADAFLQAWNHRKQLNNTSGYRGVSFCKKKQKWQAYIIINRRQIHLGFFNTREEAYSARLATELKYYGEYARII